MCVACVFVCVCVACLWMCTGRLCLHICAVNVCIEAGDDLCRAEVMKPCLNRPRKVRPEEMSGYAPKSILVDMKSCFG